MTIDLSTILGLVVGWGSLFIALLIESGGEFQHVVIFLQLSAFFIVFGGTLGATIISYPWSTIANIWPVTKQAF